MAKLIGISGSLRRASYNTGLLRAAAELVPAGTEMSIRTLHGIPLYDGDAEDAEGIPAAAAALKDSVAAADGVLLATPEYNGSLPGVLKNAIDWMSRPPADIRRVFGGRPFAITGATPGAFGTILSQTAWLGVLRTLGTQPWFEGRMLVPRAGDAFDQAGNLTDPKAREQLAKFVQGFVAFVGRARA